MSAKILFIDDDKLVLRSVSGLLKKQGYEVVAADSGFEALEKIEGERVDLIICDVRMPGMNGVDTILKLRDRIQVSGKSGVPEIMLTGYADAELAKEAKRMKVARYLYKPFDFPEFLKSIEEVLNVG